PIAVYEGYTGEVGGVPQYERGTATVYDAAGNVSYVTTGLSTLGVAHPALTHYEYDVLDRRTWVMENDLPVIGAGLVVHSYDRGTYFTYDAVGNVKSMTTGYSTNLPPRLSQTSYDYDVLNRQTDVYEGANDPAIARHTHTDYDSADNARVVV